jgi:hypothetical protein
VKEGCCVRLEGYQFGPSGVRRQSLTVAECECRLGRVHLSQPSPPAVESTKVSEPEPRRPFGAFACNSPEWYGRVRLPVMSLWARLVRRDPTFSSRHRKAMLAVSGGLALCYFAAGVLGFVLGRVEFISIAWTVLGIAWGSITACYWFKWPRRRFYPPDN